MRNVETCRPHSKTEEKQTYELRTHGIEINHLRGACVDSRHQAQRAAHDSARLGFQPDLTLFVTQSRTDGENVAHSITVNSNGNRIPKRSQ